LPRRYSDFHDSFYGWNQISSIGSIISIIGVLWFIFIIYDAFLRQNSFKGWVENTGHYNSLEWLHSSPPFFHTYNELPYVVKK
jgi:cytochrome c oxidase subunit 1